MVRGVQVDEEEGTGPGAAEVDATSDRVARYPDVEKGLGGGCDCDELSDEDAEEVRQLLRNDATKSRAARSDAVEDVRPSYGPDGKAICASLRRGYARSFTSRWRRRRSLVSTLLPLLSLLPLPRLPLSLVPTPTPTVADAGEAAAEEVAPAPPPAADVVTAAVLCRAPVVPPPAPLPPEAALEELPPSKGLVSSCMLDLWRGRVAVRLEETFDLFGRSSLTLDYDLR